METVDSPKGGQSVSCTKQVTVTVGSHVGLAAVSWSQGGRLGKGHAR